MNKSLVFSLVALFVFAIVPARAMTWTINPNNTNQIVDDTGSWTLTLSNFDQTYDGVRFQGKEVTASAYTENGANGILDLTTAEADTGYKIASIGNNRWDKDTTIREVYLPDTIAFIGRQAFRSATSLTKVKLSNVFCRWHSDGEHFNGCTALKTVYYTGVEPETGVAKLPPSIKVLPYFFLGGCTGIDQVQAPGVEITYNRALAGATSLKSVVLSPNLRTLLNNNTAWNQSLFRNDTAYLPNLVDFSPSVFAAGFNPVATDLSVTNGTSVQSITSGGNGQFASTAITNYFDFSACSFVTLPSMYFYNSCIAGATLPATLKTVGDQAFKSLGYTAGFQGNNIPRIRFLGDVPTFNGSNDNTALYPYNGNRGPKASGTSYRYAVVVDATAHPAWTNDVSTFVPVSEFETTSISDVKNYFSATSSDFPTPDHPEETLGATFLGSSQGRWNWIVQYVDHSVKTVTWDPANGETPTKETVTIGGYATAPATNPTKASTVELDYAFVGWSPDPASTVINDDTTFTATYAATTRSYDIKWVWDNGTDETTNTTSVLYGSVPTHADVSKPSTSEYSYEFLGWSTDGSTVLSEIPAVTGAATYIAVFARHDASTTVTVSWFDEDGTTPLDPATTTVTKGLQPSHAEPTKAPTIDTAYTFDGWQVVDGDGTVIATASLPAVTADVAYKAHYSAATRQYTITFADWDGSEISSTAYDYNTPAVSVVVPAETPTRPATAEYSYAFTGWDAVIADVTNDATYTATYDATPIVYTATFVNGQTSETISSADFAYGSPVTAPEPPAVEGYTFDAWVPAVSIMPASNITYTATYILNNYTITWMNADGAQIDTTKVEHGTTPTHGNASMTATTKESYAFVGWEPAIEPAVSNTTYTAVYTRTVLTPMKLALRSMEYDKDSGEITIAASVVNGESSAVTEAGVASVPLSTGETSVTDSTNIVATLSGLNNGKGYEWTVSATQTIYGVTEVAEIYGRTWARREKDWFVSESVSWIEGAYAPGSASPAGQQVRLDASVTFPAILPRARPDAAATQGVIVGIAAYQPNAGVAAAYYCWNGSEWVKLVGASPAGGAAVRIFGVVDFARKDGPAVAWYADGFQLTTESGEWEVPLAGGANLESFKRVGDFSVDSLAGDYDVGGLGFFLILR